MCGAAGRVRAALNMCHHPHLLLQEGMSVIIQVQEGAAVIHSLPSFRGGLDVTHGSIPFLPLSLDVTRTCCPFKQAVHTRTQGALVPVTGQLMPSPGHGWQEVQVCTSWRAVAHFKQSNQDIPQLWKDILFMMDFIPEYLQGMWQHYREVRDPFWSPCQEKQQLSMSQGLFFVM